MKSIVPLAAALAACCSLPAEPAKPITGVDRAYIDLKASPCEDFYNYANGAFNSFPIPGEYASYGVNQEIDERNFTILKDILETAAKTGGPKGSVAQRVGDFYAAGMDEAAIEKAGLAPLAPWLQLIAGIKAPGDLVPVIGRFPAERLSAAVNFGAPIQRQGPTQTH